MSSLEVVLEVPLERAELLDRYVEFVEDPYASPLSGSMFVDHRAQRVGNRSVAILCCVLVDQRGAR